MLKKILIFVSIISLASAAVYIYFNNPAEIPFIPCFFNLFTGLKCPGCGMTRAIYSLMHFDIISAIKFNALFIFTLFLGVLYLIAKIRDHEFTIKIQWIYIYITIMIIFTIFRNIS